MLEEVSWGMRLARDAEKGAGGGVLVGTPMYSETMVKPWVIAGDKDLPRIGDELDAVVHRLGHGGSDGGSRRQAFVRKA